MKDRRVGKRRFVQLVGVVGTVVFVAAYVRSPSWPTPDKLLVFSTLIFMSMNQGWQAFKRLFPFVVLLLAYESLRGLAPRLNSNVNYDLMIAADKLMFGGRLPTEILQDWWWQGRAVWYDYAIYLVYMLHFVLPIVLAIIIWKQRENDYWRFVATYLIVSFAGFATFVLFPAAPPWLASDKGVIAPIVRVSDPVWSGLGLKDFPSVYDKIAPNSVAAVPSLHAAYSVLLLLFVYKLFGKKWGTLAAVYPLIIFVGTVYMGDHYVIDLIIGALYAVGAYLLAPKLLKTIRRKRTTVRKNSP